MILTDREIAIAIERKLITIDPEPNSSAFSSTSVDLTLDSHALNFRDGVGDGIQVDPSKKGFEYHKIIVTAQPLRFEGFSRALGLAHFFWLRAVGGYESTYR